MSLAEENTRLKGLIEQLVARIEDNQQIARRFQDFEFRLLEALGLAELLDLLLVQGPDHFRLVAVGLVLYDPDSRYARLADSLSLNHWMPRLQLRQKPDFFGKLYGDSHRPLLGEQDALTLARLFPGHQQVASCALLPLYCRGRLQGSLHLASGNPARFTPDKANDFLAHMAAVLAICLEHCLAQEYLKREGRLDPLTGVVNRAAFGRQLEQEQARALRSGAPLSCFFVDLDHFKAINDSHGHAMGDYCLQQLTQVLAGELRRTDVLARYGGEEFVVLLPGCPRDRALETAERIRRAVAAMALQTPAGLPVPLTASIGVASWDPQAQSALLDQMPQRLLQQADAAMYQVKSQGRNGVSWLPLVD